MIQWSAVSIAYVSSMYICHPSHSRNWLMLTQKAKFMGPTWDPPGSCRPQMGPMSAPWTLLSGYVGKQAWLQFENTDFPNCSKISQPIPIYLRTNCDMLTRIVMRYQIQMLVSGLRSRLSYHWPSTNMVWFQSHTIDRLLHCQQSVGWNYLSEPKPLNIVNR